MLTLLTNYGETLFVDLAATAAAASSLPVCLSFIYLLSIVVLALGARLSLDPSVHHLFSVSVIWMDSF